MFPERLRYECNFLVLTLNKLTHITPPGLRGTKSWPMSSPHGPLTQSRHLHSGSVEVVRLFWL